MSLGLPVGRTTIAVLLILVWAVAACGIPAQSPPPTSEPTASPAPVMADPPAAVFDVQGHRGARGLRPENTLPAFETALDLGVHLVGHGARFSDLAVAEADPAATTLHVDAPPPSLRR